MNPAAPSPSAEAVALLGRLTNEGCIQTVSVLIAAGFLSPEKVEQAAWIVLGLADSSSLSAPAAAVGGEPTDEAIEAFLAERMTNEGRIPMVKTIKEALIHFGANCYDCAYNPGLCDTHSTPAAPAGGFVVDADWERQWREGWAYSYSGWKLYGDDGELQDNSVQPFIDWRKDSPGEIRSKIAQRSKRAAEYVGEPKAPAAQPSAKDGVRGDDEYQLTLTDVAVTLGEVAENFDGGEYTITDETRRVLIDFAHGLTEDSLFMNIMGHYFRQSPITIKATTAAVLVDGVYMGASVREALDAVRALCDFAYEQGFHEMGYDPVKTLEAAIGREVTNS